MNSTELDPELDVWQAAGRNIRIDYSRAVMAELGLAASDGFNRLPRGGIEIGGVLFGSRDTDGVQILAHRALACEYAFGPSFTLSENDRRALEGLLASPQTDRSLSGMQPVGCYLSHTRSGILLSEKDLQFFERYFPEIWQIALVLRPHRFDPVRAGFFFREPDGSVQAASSLQEFVIQPWAGKLDMSLSGNHAPAAPAPVSAAATVPAPAPLEPVEISRNPRMGPDARPSPPPAASNYSGRRWIWNVAVLALAFAGMLFWFTNSRAAADVSLHALDVGGQLRIDWSCNPRVIQQSENGALEIEDGSAKVLHELSPEQLRAGSVTYTRSTGNVVAHLLVRRKDRSTLTQMARFLGPPVAIVAPAPSSSAVQAEQVVAVTATPRREQEAERQMPVEQPSKPALREVPGEAEPVREKTAMTAPAPRRFVLPASGTSRLAEPLAATNLVPTPPPIAANTAPAIATVIPRLPAPVAPKTADPVPAPKAADPGPASGKIIWIGKLARRGAIQITGNHVSQGHMSGGLPGAPVRVQVFPAEMTQDGLRVFTADPKSIGAPEAPGAQNGWNRTIYVLNSRQAGDIGIVEAPGPQNAWNRLTLRAERGDHSIIVLRWERIPAASPAHAAGDR